ncbi:hypothetical protein V6N12_058290 [Hibiscus sabdariffa]|uniref:Reverse transcriptase domain-containing protein n=1 Tax=Hibiscus sabdariffa TaxID=183260 RepID=A0ABR2EUB7_9ROSI
MLGRPFLATGKAVIDVEKGELTMRVNDQRIKFKVRKTLRQPDDLEDCQMIESTTEFDCDTEMHCLDNSCLDRDQNDYLGSDYLNNEMADSETDDKTKEQEEGNWVMNTPGTKVDHNARAAQEGNRVDHCRFERNKPDGIIYPISNSTWLSPIQCVPKKGGMTVITNENNELNPTRTMTGWRENISIVFLMVTKVIIRFQLHQRTKPKPPLHAHMTLMHLEGCHSDYAMPQQPSNDA